MIFERSYLIKIFRRQAIKLTLSSLIVSVTEFGFILTFPLLISLILSKGNLHLEQITFIPPLFDELNKPLTLGLAAIAVIGLRTLVTSWSRFYQNKMIGICKSKLEKIIFKNRLTTTNEYSQLDKSKIINQLTKETEIIAYQFAVPFFSGLGELFILFLAVFSLFFISIPLGTTCLAAGLLGASFFYYINQKIIGIAEKESLAGRKKSSYIANQSLSCITEVKLYNLTDKLSDEFYNASLISSLTLGKAKSIGAVAPIGLEFAVYAFVCIFMLASPQLNTESQSLLPWWIGFGALRLMPSVNRILVAYSSVRFAIPSIVEIQRELTLFDTKESDSEPNNSINWPTNPAAPRVVLENVGFKFDDAERNVIQEITMVLEPGTVTGLVGKSGTGKSTLSRLILGLKEPTNGSITYFSSNFQLRSFLPSSAIVSNSSLILGETIRENVAISSKEYSEQRIINSLRDAGLIPDNIGAKSITEMLDRNVSTLSSGQMQRVLIARAIYSMRKLIVFDEATSMLDAGTQSIINESIKQLKPNHTILVIAHRQEALEPCDSIFEMGADGKIKKQTKLYAV